MHRRGVMRLAAGASAPPALPATGSLLLDLNAAVGVVESGGVVSSWADQSGRGLTATSVASKDPSYDATGGPGGTPAVVVAGGQAMSLSAALRPTSGPVTMMFVFDDTSPSNAFRYLVDAFGSARRIVEQMNSGGLVAYYDGAAHRTIAPSLRGAQCLTVTLASGIGRAYRGRMGLGAYDSYTEAALSGTVKLFSDIASTAQFAHGKFSRILVWDKVLSGGELSQAWAYVHSLYGVAPALPSYTPLNTTARFFGPTTDGAKGVLRWDVTSEHSSASARIEVLLPASYAYSTSRRWPVLYVLPALEGPPGGGSGDGQAQIRALGWHSAQDCIAVQVAYPTAPWWGDHATDANKRARRYLLETAMPFIEAVYQGAPERSGRSLIGMSKSGCGAVSLLVEHQDHIGYAVSWDAPLMVQSADYGIFDSATAFGTSGAWDAWLARSLLTASPPPESYARLIITGADASALYGPGPAGAYTGAEHTAGFASHCDASSVERTLNNALAGSHDWASGWLSTALAALVTAKTAGDAADPPDDSGAEFA